MTLAVSEEESARPEGAGRRAPRITFTPRRRARCWPEASFVELAARLGGATSITTEKGPGPGAPVHGAGGPDVTPGSAAAEQGWPASRRHR
jgi:hypothetical protein